MEKLVYLLMGPAGGAGASLAAELRGPVVEGLRQRGAYRIQVNVTDPSLGEPFGVEPDPDDDHIIAAVSLWVDASELSRAYLALPRPSEPDVSWHGYLVCESEPLRPDAAQHAPGRDGRIPGFAQIVALSKPENLTWGEWRRIWQGSHTSVAINTQSSFRYVQNVILRPLTAGASPYAAIVEECFPIAAASDLHVFFDAGGDEAKLARHMEAMSLSCDRFMDGSDPVSWTAEYQFP